MGKVTGATEIQVLTFLYGLPFKANEALVRGYLHALRPSEVRIVEDGFFKNNAMRWRVTVVVEDDIIDEITQEVEVELPPGMSHGLALDRALNIALRERRTA